VNMSLYRSSPKWRVVAILAIFLSRSVWSLVIEPDSTSLVIEPDSTYCPTPPTDLDPCTRITGWKHFRRVLQNPSSDMLVLCPFTVTKPTREGPVKIKSSVHIVCQKRHECIVQGKGSHIAIDGASTRVIMQHLVFEDATRTSVKVFSGAKNRQTFCDCQFKKYA
jgi:hypothetical protein